MRHVAVIDIGKSNAKLALVDLEGLAEVSVRKMPNRPLTAGRYPHHDVEAIWEFILEGLSELRREHQIDAISVTTHGATAALLKADGSLALPVLDYEHDGPDGMRSDYDAVRPPFSETGSPALPLGLNLGVQLFWQSRSFPEEFSAVCSILMYPQYWAFRLTGVSASEATSLGCHTDLWNPEAGRFASLVGQMGWQNLFPPLRGARDVLGTILPDIARRTGLAPSTPVLCGIHDSNASLLPHLLWRKPPFAVVSTGTWVVSMAVGGQKVTLDPARDTLINVDALGEPVPSARFMGGREYQILTEGQDTAFTDADIEAVLEQGIMLLPSVQTGCGPFPNSSARWIAPGDVSSGEHAVAAAFYLALMTTTCLDLAGAAGAIVVEGPFAANMLFADMLEAATGRMVLPQAGHATGTSIGAALLAEAPPRHPPAEAPRQKGADARWQAYAEKWQSRANA
ncbi:FGGY-family carbohydrate kinase [Chelativorans sp. AA-79]|uniref:FGGY-family carbohydrate kinase n=1 Tax=Chelativorans sp. AA-79 TaxID=3028735 RepID=UPI0023FA2300|nr:FGGY-family carbohydrate kinase [Chelativorans sp. AA-79]WEX08843.1 FGGY-family carbohydrate kinase [Chelativorans sp. AA-79]